ncbi:MAG: ATP-binding protein [Kiritimatiellae bacterium]|nr:ATP-binding protein [Kiritimatiellia bacterium]
MRLLGKILQWARQYPVVTLTGPRQSGKTTLVKSLFPKHAYANLENPVERDYAASDPVAFLGQYSGGVVIDEIQRVPSLLSYIQCIVDENPEEHGRFILTGSQNLQIMRGVSQSLAGRTALASLLPFSLSEIGGGSDVWETLWRGFFPRIFHDNLNPTEALAFYTATYFERDVRELVKVKDLSRFSQFLRLCAGRTGQLLNAANLAADCGIAGKTALEWVSILEASYIIRRLPPWFANVSKRLSKTPKLYFLDTGLVCYLLGIDSPGQLANNPLRGAIFETFVMTEFWKHYANCGVTDRLFHYRDGAQREIDLVDECGSSRLLVEIKSGQTPNAEWGETLKRISAALPGESRLCVIYGGRSSQMRSGVEYVSWSRIGDGPF